MIWETDENLDGAVDWDEFYLMFRRSITDKTGLEPFQLFAVVQFCMYDKEFTGKISVDETMQMLYTRCGKDKLEAEMKVGVPPPEMWWRVCVFKAATPHSIPRPSLTTAKNSMHDSQALFGDSLNAEGNSSLSFDAYLRNVKRKAAAAERSASASTTTSRH